MTPRTMERDWWDRGSVKDVSVVMVVLGVDDDDEGDGGGEERGKPLSFQILPRKSRKLISCPEPLSRRCALQKLPMK